jgi:multimeric flavodoxin WrbA
MGLISWKEESMKILAINGSHSGGRGYTRFLVDRLLSGAAAAGAETEVVDLAALKINRCLACDKCQEAIHASVDPAAFLPRCVWDGKDDVAAVFEKMAGADSVVYASPIYIFTITSLLKTFLERFYAAGDCEEFLATRSGLMFHSVSRHICSKPFVSLVCCDNIEAETPKNAVSYFRTFSEFMDAPLVGELVRNGGFASGRGKDPAREEALPLIREVYAAYVEAGRELATMGRIRKATQRRANREIIPVPGFALLKRIRLRPVKEQFVARAAAMRSAHTPAKNGE